jgi:hypothetical protein
MVAFHVELLRQLTLRGHNIWSQTAPSTLVFSLISLRPYYIFPNYFPAPATAQYRRQVYHMKIAVASAGKQSHS